MIQRTRSLLLLLAFYFACPLQAQPDAAAGSNALGKDLMPLLAKGKQNALYSPFSIYSCLSMVACGAEGSTQSAMASTLHWTYDRTLMSQAHAELYHLLMKPSDLNTGFVLQIANALFLDTQTRLLKPFETMLTSYYQAPILPVDFQNPPSATQNINQWVDLATHHKIAQLLLPGDLTRDTQMVLINTLYFKGRWASPFNPDATRELPFFYEPEKSKPTLIMHKTSHYGYFEDETFQVAFLPFISSSDAPKVSMILALPKLAGDRASLEDKIDIQTWMEEKQGQKLELFLPKMHLHQRIDLYKALSTLGMDIAFSTLADFSSISDQFQLAIGKALHEVTFDLDEQGLEATAATSVSMNRTSIDLEPSLLFDANHPFFFFLIEETTQTILFQGEYTYPSDNQ